MPFMPCCVIDGRWFPLAEYLLQYAQFLGVTLAAIGCRLLLEKEQVTLGGLIRSSIMGFAVSYLALLNLDEMQLSPARKITIVFAAGFLAEDILEVLMRVGSWGREHWRTILKLIKDKGH